MARTTKKTSRSTKATPIHNAEEFERDSEDFSKKSLHNDDQMDEHGVIELDTMDVDQQDQVGFHTEDEQDDPDDGHGHGHGHHRINPVPGDRRVKDIDHIPSNTFAGPYKSRLTELSAHLDPELHRKLSHVNCSYLSSRGAVPTLEQLKQHAQSLTILINRLSLTTQGGYIDNANITISDENGDEKPIPAFKESEAYDWLNDLQIPYQNAEEHHRLPLTSIINTLDTVRADDEAIDVCPLHRASPSEPNTPGLPYATHQSLIAHANEVLELLDHEYSAKGGLLSILPLAEEEDERALAETTILGQLILWTQRLAQRVHDLERLYANATDIIAGEAVVPSQTLSKLGVDGRMQHEMVYPQDRFVLVNAGEDVWQFLSRELDKRDRIAHDLLRNAQKHGQTKWDGSKEFSAGVSAVDITTRYFRVRNSDTSLKTIFVIPAWQEHPGTKVTREMESRPTIVSVVRPAWPERASVIEMRHREDMDDLRRFRRENDDFRHTDDGRKRQVDALKTKLHIETTRKKELEEIVKGLEQLDDKEIRKQYVEVKKALKRLDLDKGELKEEQAKVHQQIAAGIKEKEDELVKERNKIDNFINQQSADRKKEQESVQKLRDQLEKRIQDISGEYESRNKLMEREWGRAVIETRKMTEEVQKAHAQLVEDERRLRAREAELNNNEGAKIRMGSIAEKPHTPLLPAATRLPHTPQVRRRLRQFATPARGVPLMTPNSDDYLSRPPKPDDNGHDQDREISNNSSSNASVVRGRAPIVRKYDHAVSDVLMSDIHDTGDVTYPELAGVEEDDDAASTHIRFADDDKIYSVETVPRL